MARPGSKKIVIFLLIVFAAIFLLGFFYQNNIKNLFYSISCPVQQFFWRAGEGIKGYFNKESQELELQNQELIYKITSLENIVKENDLLRDALGIGLQNDFKLSFSHVIGKDISGDFILIDKGSKDGVKEKMPIITEEKVLIGKVCQVFDNFSKVILISNKKSSFDAKIQREDNNIAGVIKGIGDQGVIFDFVSRDENVLEGDSVVTSRLGGIFPEGLLVGRVKVAKKVDVEPFQKIEVDPFFNLGRLESVFIILEF
jgi:rod shape-determining protein MreC